MVLRAAAICEDVKLHPIHLVYMKRKSSQTIITEPQLHLEVAGTEWDDPAVLATVERQFEMGNL